MNLYGKQILCHGMELLKATGAMAFAPAEESKLLKMRIDYESENLDWSLLLDFVQFPVKRGK